MRFSTCSKMPEKYNRIMNFCDYEGNFEVLILYFVKLICFSYEFQVRPSFLFYQERCVPSIHRFEIAFLCNVVARLVHVIVC